MSFLSSPSEKLSASAGIVNHKSHVIIGGPEEQEASGESSDDGDEHASVKRHDGEHEKVADRRVDPEEQRSGEPGDGPLPSGDPLLEERGVDLIRRSLHGGGDPDPQTEIFHVLVERRDDHAGQQRYGVACPRGRPP